MKLAVLKEINPVKELIVDLNKLYNEATPFFRNRVKEKQALVVHQINTQAAALVVIAEKEKVSIETGNEALDLYCLEGMKLFSQGEYAKNLENKNCDLGIYL
jgi:hypothetical protein